MIPESDDRLSARERILAVAQDIFLTEGFDGVSIRELTDAAGVNVALVNYHFGSKRNLYLEVLQRTFSTVAVEKCAQLRKQLAEMESPGLQAVLTCYVSLYLGSEQSARATQQFLRLIARQLADDDDAMELLFKELIAPIHLLMRQTLLQICPQVPERKMSLCIGSLTGQIMHYLRFSQAFRSLVGLPDGASLREEMSKHIVEFSMKGIGEEHACQSPA